VSSRTRIRIQYIRVFEVCVRATCVVTEGSECVGRHVCILEHTCLSMCMFVCMCVWNSWCTRLHRGIAKPKGEHSRGSSRRAVQASCYDFQNGEAQWPRSAPDKIVIIIVLAMAGIEERYTRDRVCIVCIYIYKIYNTPMSWRNVQIRWLDLDRESVLHWRIEHLNRRCTYLLFIYWIIKILILIYTIIIFTRTVYNFCKSKVL